MTDPLVLCSACSRHIRACERACPFCAAAQPSTPVISPHVTSPTVARVASVALVAGLALAAGCVEVAHAQSRTPPAIPGPVPAYGVAPPPSMFRDAGTNPPGQSVADAGHHDAGTHHHDGGTRRRDAGVVTAPPQDPGAVHAMYGVPPAPGTIRRR